VNCSGVGVGVGVRNPSKSGKEQTKRMNILLDISALSRQGPIHGYRYNVGLFSSMIQLSSLLGWP